MKVTQRSRLRIRLQNILFVVLFLAVIGLLAWLSTRYHFQADWTAAGRNTLSPASVQLVRTLEGPLTVTAFLADAGPVRQHIRDVLARYQRVKADIRVDYVNPETSPDRVRQLGISADGELLLEYRGRSEKVGDVSETGITNALQRLARGGERWVVFIEGHGERSPLGQANHDLGVWGKQLESKGFRLKALNLASTPVIPDNTAVLVIAGPQVAYLPGEIRIIEEYVNRGGNLLWLADPGAQQGLTALAEQLGVTFRPGVIVDPTTQLLAINDPTIAIVGDYGIHPITQGLSMLTVYPQAVGLEFEAQGDWTGGPFLTTTERSWSETGPLRGSIGFDEGRDIRGPLTLGVAVTRARPGIKTGDAEAAPQQRVAVVGDGDFLSNAFIGNGGNLELGFKMLNWLSSDDALIDVPVKTAPDVSLNLSQTQTAIIGFGFLVVLPLAFIGAGVWIWWRRRKA